MTRSIDLRAAIALLALLGVGAFDVACSPKSAAPEWLTCEAAATPDAGTPTWHADVHPIVATHCARCHTERGIGPMPLETYSDVADAKQAVLTAVDSRKMPPWAPAPCCNRFKHDASLSDPERATLHAWVEQGAPEGDPATAAPITVAPRGLPRVDVSAQMPEPYEPKLSGGNDDTRCFLVDWPETETKYVTGLDIKPGVPTIVHHALVLIAGLTDLRQLEDLDARDDGPGWSCPGGLVPTFSGYLGGWSPGFDATILPDGLGHEVKPGSKLLLTVHYSPPSSGHVAPDQTTIEVMHQAEKTTLVKSIPAYDPAWALGGMPIPKDKSDVSFAYELDPTPYYGGGKGLTLWAANLHMHERGSRGRINVRHADGTEECLLQIDAYDHHWQGDFAFAEPHRVEPGDSLRVECVFDNTASHQRIVDGVRQPARDLNWGEDQEMCIGFVTATDDTQPLK